MELHKLTILVVLLTTLRSRNATITGLTYKDSIEQRYPGYAPGDDVCHPLYWYPRPIPVFCETITLRPRIKSTIRAPTATTSPTTTSPIPTHTPEPCPPCPPINETTKNATCKPCFFVYPQFIMVPQPIVAIPFMMSSPVLRPVLSPPVFPGPPMVPMVGSPIPCPFASSMKLPCPPPLVPSYLHPPLPPPLFPQMPQPIIKVVPRPVSNILNL